MYYNTDPLNGTGSSNFQLIPTVLSSLAGRGRDFDYLRYLTKATSAQGMPSEAHLDQQQTKLEDSQKSPFDRTKLISAQRTSATNHGPVKQVVPLFTGIVPKKTVSDIRARAPRQVVNIKNSSLTPTKNQEQQSYTTSDVLDRIETDYPLDQYISSRRQPDVEKNTKNTTEAEKTTTTASLRNIDSEYSYKDPTIVAVASQTYIPSVQKPINNKQINAKNNSNYLKSSSNISQLDSGKTGKRRKRRRLRIKTQSGSIKSTPYSGYSGGTTGGYSSSSSGRYKRRPFTLSPYASSLNIGAGMPVQNTAKPPTYLQLPDEDAQEEIQGDLNAEQEGEYSSDNLSPRQAYDLVKKMNKPTPEGGPTTPETPTAGATATGVDAGATATGAGAGATTATATGAGAGAATATATGAGAGAATATATGAGAGAAATAATTGAVATGGVPIIVVIIIVLVVIIIVFILLMMISSHNSASISATNETLKTANQSAIATARFKTFKIEGVKKDNFDTFVRSPVPNNDKVSEIHLKYTYLLNENSDIISYDLRSFLIIDSASAGDVQYTANIQENRSPQEIYPASDRIGVRFTPSACCGKTEESTTIVFKFSKPINFNRATATLEVVDMKDKNGQIKNAANNAVSICLDPGNVIDCGNSIRTSSAINYGNNTDYPVSTGTIQMSCPLSNSLGVECTSGFNDFSPLRERTGPHTGIDMASSDITTRQIISPVDGTIIYVSKPSAELTQGGRLYQIQDNNDPTISYLIAHIQPDSGLINYKVGDRVTRGAILGTPFRGGSIYPNDYWTGPHIHFEVRKNNEPIDAEQYILESCKLTTTTFKCP